MRIFQLPVPWGRFFFFFREYFHVFHNVSDMGFQVWGNGLLSGAGSGRKPGVAGSHCACRWYLESLQVSNSHWTRVDRSIRQDLKIFGTDEFVWISEAETNDALLDAKSTLSERAASLCFFNPYQTSQWFWKAIQRIVKIIYLLICCFCRGTMNYVTMLSRYVDTMFCINL